MAGIGGEGANTAHQQKKILAKIQVPANLPPEEKVKREEFEGLKQFRDRFYLPIPDDQLAEVPYYKPPADSPEMKYLLERRSLLGGHQPARNTQFTPCDPPRAQSFERLLQGTGESGKGQSTTLAWVNLMMELCRDPHVGKLIAIVLTRPDLLACRPCTKFLASTAGSASFIRPWTKAR